MFICLKCKKEHDGSFASGKYCSKSCANSRVWSNNSKVNRSNIIKIYYSNLSSEDKKRIYGKSGPKISVTRQNLAKIKRVNTDSELLSYGQRKLKILEEQEFKCNICGINNWLGKKLTFELDHIDGNKQNNTRNNLRILCPNCHSQTPTWRGRNDKKREPKNYNKLDSSSDKAPA